MPFETSSNQHSTYLKISSKFRPRFWRTYLDYVSVASARDGIAYICQHFFNDVALCPSETSKKSEKEEEWRKEDESRISSEIERNKMKCYETWGRMQCELKLKNLISDSLIIHIILFRTVLCIHRCKILILIVLNYVFTCITLTSHNTQFTWRTCYAVTKWKKMRLRYVPFEVW